ncbi:MAG TPA: toll/interleukin-1 receptor domain-containing protein [Nitrospira sp.]|nr:toll/interleukin-1 receptor domain-containing protein [Nitrospira sp.]
MSDIFISYASEDRPWVEPFAKALEQRGWAVWWDRHIPTGQTYDDVIWSALQAAKCVVVVWSAHSIASEWVKEEAGEAKKKNILLPVRIDEARPPFGFSRRQTQSLVGWQDGSPHPGFDQLVKDTIRLLGSKPADEPQLTGPWWERIPPLWLVSLPAALAAAVVIVLMLWPISARVHVELTTERVEFEIGATEQGKTILGGLDFRSVAIERFATIAFEPDTFKVADPSRYRVKTDDFPDAAWKSLSVTNSKVTLVAKDQTRHPRVTVEGLIDDGSPTIHLDPLAVAQGVHLSLEMRGGKNEGLTVKVAGLESMSLSLRGGFKLIADHTELRGNAEQPFHQNDELTYRVTLPERASWIEITAQPDGPVLSPTFTSSQSATSIFSGIPVATLDFTRQDSSGQRVSALTGQGTITFPDHPHLGSVSLSKDDAIGLVQLNRFTIKEITLVTNAGGLRLVGDGMAEQIRTKIGQIPIQSRRLTKFDDLWRNERLAVLFTIVAAVFTTSLGAYRLWKEFNR